MFTLIQQWDPKRSRSQEFEKGMYEYGDLSHAQYLCHLLVQIDQCVASGDTSSQQMSTQMSSLKQEITKLHSSENMMTVICKCFDDFVAYKQTVEPLTNILHQMNLSKDKELHLLVAASFCVHNDLRQWAKNTLKDALSSHLLYFINNSNFCSYNAQILQRLLALLKSSRPEFGIDNDSIEKFKSVVRTHYQQGNAAPLIFKPFLTDKIDSTSTDKREILLPNETQVAEYSLETVLREAGYPVVADKTALRLLLSQLRCETHLTPKAVAMAICMFLQSCSTISTSPPRPPPAETDPALLTYTAGVASASKSSTHELEWDVENFLTVLFEVNLKLNFREVVQHFDCARFSVPSPEALSLLKRCLVRGMKENLPINELFYRPWKHSVNQLYLLKQCIEHPHILNLDFLQHRTVELPYLQGQPSPTDPQQKFWLNLDLIEILLRIGEADLGDEVGRILKKPCSEHPEIVLCGFLQAQTKMSPLKQTLLMALIKRFFATSALPLNILKIVWESDNKENKPSFRDIFFFIILKDFYEKPLQDRWLTVEKTCAIAVEVKGISDFLNIQDLRFNLRFAVVAYKDDEVSLEKTFRHFHEKYGSDFQHSLQEIYDCPGKAVTAIVKNCAYKYLSPVITGLNPSMKEANQSSGGGYPLDLSMMDPHLSAAAMKDSGIVGNTSIQRLFSQGSNIMGQGSNLYAGRTLSDQGFAPGARMPAEQQQQQSMDGDMQFCEEILSRLLRGNGGDDYMKCVGNTEHYRIHFAMVKYIFLRYLGELDNYPDKEKFIDVLVQALRMLPAQRQAEVLKSLAAYSTQSPYSVSEVIVRLGSYIALDGVVLRHFYNHNIFSRLTPNCQKFIQSVMTSEDTAYNDMRKYRLMDNRSNSLAPGPAFNVAGVVPNVNNPGPGGNDLSTGMAVGSQRMVSNQASHLAASQSRTQVPGTAQSQDLSLYPSSASNNAQSGTNANLLQQQRRFATPNQSGMAVDGSSMATTMAPQGLTTTLIQAAHSDQRSRHTREELRPSNEVQSSVSFIFNNVCRSNVDIKVRELMDVVPPESIGWLVKTIVVRRVTSDHNFHELFLYIIDALNERYNFVRNRAIQDVLRIIRHILGRIHHSEDDFNNRTILKYLANFLGLLTLSKNRPIFSEEMNFKELLCEAFNLGTIEMNFVVPFVSRCLEHVKSSVVFKPPNPWTMGHLRVLKELHSMDESEYVTSTARFEVEILFSALGLDIKEVEPSNYLHVRENFEKLHQRLISVEFHPPPPPAMPTHISQLVALPQHTSSTVSVASQQSQQQVNSTGVIQQMTSRGASQPQAAFQDPAIISHQGMQPGQYGPQGHSIPSEHMHSDASMALSGQHGMFAAHTQTNQMQTRSAEMPHDPQQQSQLQLVSGAIASPIHQTSAGKIRYCDIPKLENVNNLAKFIQLDSSLVPNNNHEIRNHIIACIQKSFHDILCPILERCRRQIRPTIKTLLKRDFGLDPDPARLQASSQAMTRFLACAVSFINSRDLILLSISTAYKQGVLSYIPTATSQQKESVERGASLAAMANIDILVAHMQKFIAETLVQEMDAEMYNEYMARFQAKRDNLPFASEGRVAQINKSLPDKLKKSPRGPSADDMKVYEEFLRTLPGFQPNGYGCDFGHTVMTCDLWQQSQFSKRRSQIVGHDLASNASVAPGGPLGSNYHISSGAIVSHPTEGVTTGGSTPPNVATLDSNSASFMCPNLYDSIFSELERQLQAIRNILSGPDPIKNSLRGLIDAVHLAMTSSLNSSPQQVLRITITNLMDNYDTRLRSQPKGHEVLERFKEAHLVVIRLMLTSELQPFSYSWITHQITNTWKNMSEEASDTSLMHMGKWNFDPFTELLKIHVISLSQLDEYLAEEITKNKIRAIAFSLDLFEHYIIGEKREFTVLNEYDIYTTIERILSLSKNGLVNLNCDEALQRRVASAAERMRDYLDMGLLEHFQIRGSNCLYSGCSQSREFDDQTVLAEKTEQLMRRWFEIQASHLQRDYQEFRKFLKQMLDSSILENEDSITRFFRLAAVLVVERALNKLKCEANSNAGPNARFSSYSELDAYSRLLALLIKEAGKNNDDILAKPRLLNKALGIISGVLIQEHEVRPQWFNPMPFHRILIILFMELSDDNTLCSLSLNIMAAFCNTLHILRPARTAAFVFSWLEIVGHRVFMHRMLASPQAEDYRPMYVQLLVNLLKYIHTFLNQNHMSNAVIHLYKGILRLFLVLNRDFPDLLSDYHALFCDFIPPTAFQLRNIILSATPRSRANNAEPYVRHTPLQIADVVDPKGYCMNAGDRIAPATLKGYIDSFLVSRTPVEFLSFLIDKLRGKPSDPYPYSIEMMSNLVIYLCITTVKYLREKNLSITKNNISPTSQMDVIQYMILNLDSAGRYLLLNVMANQLRYPNSHTYYFMQTFLFLFTEAKEEQVKEQITRVLLERLLVHRPHPWGLLATMSELMGNSEHKFWNYDFTRCATEIESVLRNVYQNLLRPEAP